MKRNLAIILSMVCILNFTACSGKESEQVHLGSTIDEADIEAIFAPLHRSPEEEKSKEKPKKEIKQTVETPDIAESETEREPIEGVPIEYSHLFGTGDFDENLVWTTYDEEYSELAQALYEYCEESVMGSVMLATDEDVIFAGGFNAKETDEETRVNPFTTYEIGSLTQQFTAAAIIQQIQEGNLKGSDTLDKFFPEYPHGSEISVDNLLHMDSGIPDYINDSMHFFIGRTAEGYEAFMNGQMPDEEILGYMNKAELLFEPGKKADSSNINYYLLALILEQVTGLTYEEYMQAYLLDACGLKSTSCVATDDLTCAPQGNGSTMAMGRVIRGAGDMHSNVCDVLIFNRELMGGRILDEEHLEYMTTARNEYACGWFDAGGSSLGQYSSTDGYICVNFIYRLEDENFYFVMMIPDRTKWSMPGNTMDVVESYLE